MPPRINGCYIPRDRAEHFAARAFPLEVHEVLENRDYPLLWVKNQIFRPFTSVFSIWPDGRRKIFVHPGHCFKRTPIKKYVYAGYHKGNDFYRKRLLFKE